MLKSYLYCLHQDFIVRKRIKTQRCFRGMYIELHKTKSPLGAFAFWFWAVTDLGTVEAVKVATHSPIPFCKKLVIDPFGLSSGKRWPAGTFLTANSSLLTPEESTAQDQDIT